MKNFKGRQRELDVLQSKYDKNNFCMSIIYGRRRIGKTTLINEFINRQDCIKISFTAVEQNEHNLLSMMTEVVLTALSPDMLGVIDFNDFDKLFEYIGKYAEKKRVILFIDEYPYLVKQCPYIQSLLQKHIDTSWSNTNMFLVLCGSLVAFMKDEVLAESAPLYGRSDLEMKLRPFSYYETALFLENYSNEEKAIVYGLTGGVAKYIRQFDDRKPLDENIIEQFFSMEGYFTEEQVKTVITGEKQNPVLYNSIISAIADGHTKNNEIAISSGVKEVTYPLKVLVNSEIIEKRISKKPYYIINDSMLLFYFTYVSRATSLINAGNGRIYYKTQVKSKLHNFMGKVFEKMAKDYLLKNAGTKNIPLMDSIVDLQKSVIDSSKKSHQVEIDLCGKMNNNIVLVGECKFTNKRFDNTDLEAFMEKLNLLKINDVKVFLFSLSGYTDYVYNNSNNITFITLDDMY